MENVKIVDLLGDPNGCTVMPSATIPQFSSADMSVVAIAERECEALTKTAEQMQRRFAEQGDYATALVIQQQIVGCRLMRDAIQSAFKSR